MRREEYRKHVPHGALVGAGQLRGILPGICARRGIGGRADLVWSVHEQLVQTGGKARRDDRDRVRGLGSQRRAIYPDAVWKVRAGVACVKTRDEFICPQALVAGLLLAL